MSTTLLVTGRSSRGCDQRDMSGVVVEGKLFSGSATSAVVRAANKTKSYAVGLAKQRSRVDTGAMQRGWYGDIKRGGNSVQLAIKNDVYYAPFQEYGTKHVRPMLAGTRAVEESLSYFKEELQRELSSELGGRLESIERSTERALSIFFRGLK